MRPHLRAGGRLSPRRVERLSLFIFATWTLLTAPRAPHSGPSSLGLDMSVLPTFPPPASQTET